jgi:hypothetical protein
MAHAKVDWSFNPWNELNGLTELIDPTAAAAMDGKATAPVMISRKSWINASWTLPVWRKSSRVAGASLSAR